MKQMRLTLLVVISLVFFLTGCSNQPRVSEDEIRHEYDTFVTQYRGKTEYQVRHILVERRDQAEMALTRIKGGESFARVAASVSIDPGSNSKGGELGWAIPEYFVEEFSRTMVKLAPQGISSTPTQTRFGWHVIEVTSSRLTKLPPYSAVRDTIEKKLIERKSEAK